MTTLDTAAVLTDLLRIAAERAGVDLDPLLRARLVAEMVELLDLGGVELHRDDP